MPRFHTGARRVLFPDPRFSAMKQNAFDHTRGGDLDTVVGRRVLSVSVIAARSAAERVALRADLDRLPRARPALAGRAHVSFPDRRLAIRMPGPDRGPSGTAPIRGAASRPRPEFPPRARCATGVRSSRHAGGAEAL